MGNLTIDKTEVNGGDSVKVGFQLSYTLTGGEQTWFKAGDVVRVATNMGDLFDFATFTQSVRDGEGNVIGELKFDQNEITITLNEKAEELQSTFVSFAIDSGADRLRAKDLSSTTENVVKTLTVGDAKKDLTWLKKEYRFAWTSSGLGSLTLQEPAGFTSGGIVTDVSADNAFKLLAKVNAGTTQVPDPKILTIQVVYGDGSVENIEITNDQEQLITITADKLKLGINTLRVIFSDNPIPDAAVDGWASEKTVKSCYGTDTLLDLPGSKYSGNYSITVGNQITKALYHSNGTSLALPEGLSGVSASAAQNTWNNVLFEDTLPGGVYGPLLPASLQISAAMPGYLTNANGTYSPLQPEFWGKVYLAASTNLVPTHMTLLTQNTGESLDQFRVRVQETTFNYGVYVDAATGDNTILVNLGSPSNKDVPGLKTTDLWPEKLAADPILNRLNGEGNAVGGKVVYFRITYRTDNSKVDFPLTLKNTATVSLTDGNGNLVTGSSTSYQSINPGSASATLGQGEVLIIKLDAADGTTFLPEGSSGNALGEFTITEGDTSGKIFRVLNTKAVEPEPISIDVTKVWNDQNDQDGLRPESVSV